GQVLVDRGLASAEDVRRCIGEQAQDLVVELLRARRGRFALRRGLRGFENVRIAAGFSVDMLLFEGLRRIDEWRVIEREVPSLAARFERASGDESGLSDDDRAVLARLERPRNARELSAELGLRAVEVCRSLYRLASLRRVRR